MPYQMIKYIAEDAIACITLNRPEKYNTLRMEMIQEFDDALRQANQDDSVKVIVLEGAGDSFCGGFDFSGGLDHYEKIKEEGYDPGVDIHFVTNQYLSYIPAFMGLWRGLKPTIAKVHGYCVGGGSELALCADLVVASDDARLGTPYSRVWGCHLTGMWVYRLGLAKAKYYALTGEWISGKEAALHPVPDGEHHDHSLRSMEVAAAATPEPGSMLLFGSAAGLLGWWRKRKG